MASLHGAPALAFQLETLGLVSQGESLEEAIALRPLTLDAVEDARKGANE